MFLFNLQEINFTFCRICHLFIQPSYCGIFSFLSKFNCTSVSFVLCAPFISLAKTLANIQTNNKDDFIYNHKRFPILCQQNGFSCLLLLLSARARKHTNTRTHTFINYPKRPKSTLSLPLKETFSTEAEKLCDAMCLMQSISSWCHCH